MPCKGPCRRVEELPREHRALLVWEENPKNDKATDALPTSKPLLNIICLLTLIWCACCLVWSLHWNGNVIMLSKFSSLPYPKVAKMKGVTLLSALTDDLMVLRGVARCCENPARAKALAGFSRHLSAGFTDLNPAPRGLSLYKDSQCGDKTIWWLPYHHNGISDAGKMATSYRWVSARKKSLHW